MDPPRPAFGLKSRLLAITVSHSALRTSDAAGDHSLRHKLAFFRTDSA